MQRKLGLILLLVFLLSLVSFGGAAAQDDEPIVLRMTWWGNEARTAKYNEILDLYEELNPGIRFEREFTGDFGGYWDKLATQIAANNAPDLIIMHLNFINEYASRGALVELTDYIESGRIDLSNFSQGALNAGMVDGVPYMVTLGLTPRAALINPRLFAEAGVDLPPADWTWSDFVANATAIAAATEEGIYGAADQGMTEVPFFLYLGQRGKNFFEGDMLGFEREDLLEWWTMWNNMRNAGAIPPAEVTTESQTDNQADHVLSAGRVAMFISPGNQFPIFQENAVDELQITTIPRSEMEGAIPYNYAGGAFMSIATQSQHPDEVADFINWFVNDPDVALMYAGEHGPPGSTESVELLAPTLSEADAKLYDFFAQVADYVQPQPSQATQGREVLAAYERVYTELMFGNLSVEEAVDAFFEEADFILGG